MAGEASQDDRTQPASQRQTERARAEGNIPHSREVAGLAGMAAAAMLLLMMGPRLAQTALAGFSAVPATLDTMTVKAASSTIAAAAGAITAPIVFGLMAAALAAGSLQSGLVLRTSALLPDPARLDPRRGLARLFGTDTLVETAKSALKLCLFAYAIWQSLASATPKLLGAARWSASTLADALAQEVLGLLVRLIAIQAALTAADIAWVRHRHARSLRMTREQVRQEAQETEGNPHVKARLRQLRSRRARQRMLAAVPRATVIVTNPTHYAIALAYDRSAPSAPRVIAKGVDEVAARIRAAAAVHGVPVVANPPLARALYATDLDTEIATEHFKAVAEIIAYVWRLRDRVAGPARA